MTCFERLHPITSFIYFILVLLNAVFTMNPVIVIVCFVSSLVFSVLIFGIREILKSLAYSIPVMLMIVITNFLFVHRGQTILFFLNDNPVTLEAVLFGTVSSMMIMAVYYWCKCYTKIMTSDKFIYLFGRIMPKLSLVLSMALGLIPKLKENYRTIDDAQKAMGIYASKSYLDKIKSKFRVFSVLVSSSLEGAIETSDSMRSRGYGLPHRTSYSNFYFTTFDRVLLIGILVVGIMCFVLIGTGASYFSFYPEITPVKTSLGACLLYILITLLTGISALLEIKENILWRYLKSKI